MTKVLCAYLLCVLGGKAHPTTEDVEAVLNSIGASVDKEMVSLVISKLKDQDISALTAKGISLFSAGGSGVAGSSAGPVAAAAPAAAAAAVAAPKEAPKHEKKEKPPVEEVVEEEDMGFGLFD